ncbi:MAG TPA: hypothetical protein DD713_03435 [Nitrospiraceae bacterium]|nr:hypothetical protein [Nitrospiraceae bacterium]
MEGDVNVPITCKKCGGEMTKCTTKISRGYTSDSTSCNSPAVSSASTDVTAYTEGHQGEGKIIPIDVYRCQRCGWKDFV